MPRCGQFDVVRMVVGQGFVLAVTGLGVGLIASAGAARGLAAVFPGGVVDSHPLMKPDGIKEMVTP